MAVALANKYRPKGWESVCDQTAIKLILKEQIESETHKNAYLFTGGAGTGKTTCARIFANELNKHEGNPIEIDAASNNGVEDVRKIISEAKFKSIDSQYRIYIIDECVEGKTEILTNQGWKRIDSISENEIVAQYTDEGNVEFVPIDEYIVKDYIGDMYKVSFRNGKKSVLMSPHHVQPVRMKNSKKIVESYIKDCKFAQSNEIIVSGKGTGNNEILTSKERLYIACQADGYCGINNLWELHLSIPEKINRALELLDDCSINYKIYGDNSKNIRFYVDFPESKKLQDYFDINMGLNRAKDFISEILLWDGSTKSGYPGYYSCIDKDNVDFVSAILSQCGYSGNQNVTHYDNPNHNDIYSVNWYYQDFRPSSAVSKELIEDYNGKIYCVKVPSHKIILRADGFTFISGNCHMLSTGAWNALLKLLEEPPKETIFIMCTTDPQKIPQTILSRVQRYDFQRISFDSIVSRLEFIINQENKENVGEGTWTTNDVRENEELEAKTIHFEKDALEYIAKLSDGGLRDAITLLDKCISYNSNLTIENITEALGTVDYSIYFNLTNCLLNNKKQDAITIIENVYNSGKDIKQFIKQYLSFLIDCNKYLLYNNFSYIRIPSTYSNNLESYKSQYEPLLLLLRKIANLDNELKYNQEPKSYIELVILLMEL